MDDNFKWKSDKECYDCKTEHRKDIIKEIQTQAGCKKCKKFNTIRDKDLIKKENR